MIHAIRKTSAVDEVFKALHGLIISGELPVGHRFPPQEIMAEQFGVSRSTIREAINKLTVLGFLAAKPGVGTTVVSDGSSAYVSALSQHIFLHSDEVAQFMEARLYLEKAAVRLAVLKASYDDITRLAEIIEEQDAAYNQNNPDMFSSLDAQFHRTIIEISGNQVLMQFLGLIWDGLSQFIREVVTLQSAVENALHFHRLLLHHLKTRNLAGVERTLVEHLMDVVINIEKNLGHALNLNDILQLELETNQSLSPN